LARVIPSKIQLHSVRRSVRLQGSPVRASVDPLWYLAAPYGIDPPAHRVGVLKDVSEVE